MSMSITHFCFAIGSFAALIGMGLGVVMGISQDFSLTPVHAHLNLLGWVTMALYGLYHRGRSRATGRLEWTQVSVAALGFPLMTGGLAMLLTDGKSVLAEAVVIAGSLCTSAAMALFFGLVVKDARQWHRRHLRPSVGFDFDPNSG